MLWLAALGLYTDYEHLDLETRLKYFKEVQFVAAVVLIFDLKASKKDIVVISNRWLGLKSSSSHLKMHLQAKHSISTA